jgi:hypothetical protein
MAELVSPERNIAACSPSQLMAELNLDSYAASISHLNCNEQSDGSWNIWLYVSASLTAGEETEYDATLSAHTPS